MEGMGSLIYTPVSLWKYSLSRHLAKGVSFTMPVTELGITRYKVVQVYC